MAEPFLSEIRVFSFNFPPKGWALCNGQLLPINQNRPLFALLGTQFGGNGQTNFALPNLRGRVPLHRATNFNIGQAAGEEAHTITTAEMPAHTHPASFSAAAGDVVAPSTALPAQAANLYGPAASLTSLAPATVANVGGSQPHTNMQPYLVLNFCIALQGIFPSPN